MAGGLVSVMATDLPHDESSIDRRGLTIGVVVGIPAAIGAGALMATARSFFDTTNAALVLMIVVVAVAALGGRVAGVVTGLPPLPRSTSSTPSRTCQ